MSGGDDIVFEDVSYREPQKLRRPDRDGRFACLAYEVARVGDLPIFLDRRPADAIERHALRDTGVELGGILLGRECVDDETGEAFVWVTEALEAKHYENTQASFTYTHDSWEEITRERDRQFPELDIVGWYHTHPDFGIFLSGMDLFIHHNFFPQPLQVAYVVDPIRQTRGFFRWNEGQMEQVGGYFLTAPRGERIALSRLADNLENIPSADPVGGGLSPRLEAELIAMLTRPQQTPAMVQSQATAAVFSLLGMAVGVLAVVGFLWLQAMNQNIVNLAKETKALADVQDATKAASDKALDVERVRAKEAALDALLREVRPGVGPETFTASFVRAVEERDEARRKVAQKVAAAEQLEVGLAAIKAESRGAQVKLEDLRKKYDEIYDEARKKDKGREEELKAKDARLAEMDDLLKEKGVAQLLKQYGYAKYAAIAGWVASLLLGLGLLVALGRPLPAAEEPPHAIT